MDTAPEVTDKPGALAVDHLGGTIKYHHVSFSYDSNHKVLDDLSLSINQGETVAFVGPSGAGKTTICSLLPRFYDVNNGKVTIDGYDVRDLTLSSLRRQIGIVQQDVFLFGGTLRENIVYGNLVASESQIWEATQRAHLEDFIFRLDRGA
jgi:ATP-binding cassette subfamily B protein